MVTVIGIGTDKGELCEKAAALLQSGKAAVLRTARTAAGKDVAKRYAKNVTDTLDGLYEQCADFDEFYARAVQKLLAYDDVLYLTDGDGYDDGVVHALQNAGAAVRVVAGIGPHAALSAADGTLRITATALVGRRPYLDGRTAVHVTELDNAQLASEVKLFLMKTYGDETEVVVSVGGKTQTCPLYGIDRLAGYGYNAELFIAQNESYSKARYTYGDLVRIIAVLSAPDGCPWDRVQTHESIRGNMIEEAYEAVDAIDRGDRDGMLEEFGDVLLQSVLQSDIAFRAGEFDQSDVITALCEKLVSRHRHIFGGEKAADAAEALKVWEAAKSDEKHEHTLTEKIARLPESFPSLLRAQKIAGKLQKAGACADFSARFNEALAREAYGEALYFLAAYLREKGADAEVALNGYLGTLAENIAACEKAGTLADIYGDEEKK